MTDKAEVVEIIKRHLCDIVDNLNMEQIDPMDPMTKYGANSLDIVDVVSYTMRELKIKVSRTELVNVNNIDELATLFCQHTKMD